MRKKRKREITPEQSSKFVEDFSRHCYDNGITHNGGNVIPKSDIYYANYDLIDWGKSPSVKRRACPQESGIDWS